MLTARLRPGVALDQDKGCLRETVDATTAEAETRVAGELRSLRRANQREPKSEPKRIDGVSKLLCFALGRIASLVVDG